MWKFLTLFLLSQLFIPLTATRAAAQEIPAPVLEISGGSIAFTEATESFLAGAARFYVKPRLSIGPEVTYIFADGHSHVVVTGNVVYDFLRPPRRFTPFVVAGGGIFHSREEFRLLNQVSTHTEAAFTAGGGIRSLLGNRVVVGADVRVGWELHVRLGGTIGVRLGK
jgi:hypothetical protein